MSEAIADSLFSWLDAAGNTNTLDVDVVMSTGDRRTARLTDHVVETGAVVTDHIVIQPETLTFELLVTQTPMGGEGFTSQTTTLEVSSRALVPATLPIQVPKNRFQPGGFLRLTTGLRAALEGILGAATTPTQVQGSESKRITSSIRVSALQAAAPVDRVNDAFDTLVEILNTGLLVTVSFKGRLYLDYLLTSIELTQGKNEFGCGRFKVEARAFRTVTGTNVLLPDPADFRALPKVSKGNTPAKATDDPTKTKRGESLVSRNDTLRKAVGLENRGAF